MCYIDVHSAPHIHVGQLTVMADNYDPSRTLTLRNRFASALRGRFNELSATITDAIVNKDVFGLKEPTVQQASPRQFNFPRSQDKVTSFMDWLRKEVDRGILEIQTAQQMGSAADRAWTNMYIKDSYRRGVVRGRQEMRKAGYKVPSLDETGGIQTSMSSPFHADRLGLLYTRTFNDLKGITDQMDTQISRVLTQGIADGDNPRRLARKMSAVIKGGGADLALTDTLGRYIPARRRADILARTEIIRAHHKATIQEYRNWGAEGVKVKAEWVTAGDNRVCSQCADLEGNVYSIDEIENMIPRHPQCRCIALPLNAADARQLESARQTRAARGGRRGRRAPSPAKDPHTLVKERGWQIRGKGADTAEEFNSIYQKNVPSAFDIVQLEDEMRAVFKKYDITPNDFVVKTNNIASGRIELHMNGVSSKGNVVKIQRWFKGREGVYRAEHELFTLPKHLQGKGFSKDVLKTWYKQYQKGNIDTIILDANLDVGGYAWGRYGFQSPYEETQQVLDHIYALHGSQGSSKARGIVNEFYEFTSKDTPFPMNLLADLPEGRSWLLGSAWRGTLNLQDVEQIKRFEQYLGL